jgi:hypothetical protein
MILTINPQIWGLMSVERLELSTNSLKGQIGKNSVGD